MALSQEVQKTLIEIREETQKFEVALRTSFVGNTTNNHVVIQRVNLQCMTLKAKVREVTKKILDTDYHSAHSTIDTAVFYIGKYEQIIERGLPLKGDLLILASKTPKEIERMIVLESSRKPIP